MPEQPEERTPTRKPRPLPRLARKSATCEAARSVSTIDILVAVLSGSLLESVLGAIVRDGRLDRVFGQDRAMELHRRQRQLVGDLHIADGSCLLERPALAPVGHE